MLGWDPAASKRPGQRPERSDGAEPWLCSGRRQGVGAVGTTRWGLWCIFGKVPEVCTQGRSKATLADVEVSLVQPVSMRALRKPTYKTLMGLVCTVLESSAREESST